MTLSPLPGGSGATLAQGKHLKPQLPAMRGWRGGGEGVSATVGREGHPKPSDFTSQQQPLRPPSPLEKGVMPAGKSGLLRLGQGKGEGVFTNRD